MRPRSRWRDALALAVCVPLAVLWLPLLARGSRQQATGSETSDAVGTTGAGRKTAGDGVDWNARPLGLPAVPALPAPPARPGPPALAAIAIAELRSRDLRLPIDGADVERWKGSFEETHNGHRHEAVDILAPRDTPIHAVSDGRIAKLFVSKAGGLTVYEMDPSERYIYYYAHLDRYAEGLREGDTVTRGQIVGYVGTSGNASPDRPHLHFTIFRVNDPKRWWEGTAIDPYEVYTKK